MKGKRRVPKESLDMYLEKYGPSKTKNDTIRNIEIIYGITRVEAYTRYIEWKDNFMKSKRGI